MKAIEIPIGGRMKISPQNVILLEADINYTRLYLHSGEQLIVATTLKKLEKRFILFQNFFRTHKSHIINLDYLFDYQADKHEVILKNQKKVLISRRRKNAFQSKINDKKSE